jgi:Fe-S-cluster containining protein
MDNAASPMVEVNFTLNIGSGRLDASAVVPAGETNLTQLLPVLQDLSSSTIDSAVQIVESEGFHISCRAGCAACCRQLVPLSIFEAELLADWISSLPEERQTELAARFTAALMQLHSAGILPRLDSSIWPTSDPEQKTLSIEYLRLRVDCPFLENELCSIHSIRPLACREYLVTSPPENCVDPSEFPVVGVRLPLKFSPVLFNLGTEVDPASSGWMPLVFLLVWIRTRGGHPGQAVTGPGPILLHEIVKRLVASSEE